MKIYIASRFDQYKKVLDIAEAARALQMTPLCSWAGVAKRIFEEDGRGGDLPFGHPVRKREATRDLKELFDVEGLLLFCPAEGGRGMWTEMGYFLALAQIEKVERGSSPPIVLFGPGSTKNVFAELDEATVLQEKGLADMQRALLRLKQLGEEHKERCKSREEGLTKEEPRCVVPPLGPPWDSCEEEATADPVNHPSHYTQGNIEVIDFIEDQQLGFHEGNVVKYVARARHKGKELQDLKKARWYLERRITELS